VKHLIFNLFFVLQLGIVDAQDQILFHSYTPTASSWDIFEWNLQDTAKVSWVLKETVDDKGRVTQLEFLKDGELIKDPLCYLANKITFEYHEDRIIEKLYHFDAEMLSTECEARYSTTYFLNEQGFITRSESLAKFDFTDFSPDEIAEIAEFIPERVIQTDILGINLQVDYFYHSFAKMNGIYPTNENFIFDDDYYYGDEPERQLILKGLVLSKN
jgi:hypothetical protein